MANKHFFLKNDKNQRSGFNRQRGFNTPEDEKQQTTPKTIKLFQIQRLKSNYEEFNKTRNGRYSRRTIEFPEYIDLVVIYFFTVFTKDLRNKFYLQYGLTPIVYNDFNKTVLFEISSLSQFENFKKDIELISSHQEDLAYSGEDFNLIALISHFEFLDKRTSTDQEEGVILTTIQSANRFAKLQKDELRRYLDEKGIEYDSNASQEIIFMKKVEKNVVAEIDNNFDIVKGITSSRALTIRPGTFGDLRVEYGFEAEILEKIPTIGVIDTGVREIQPFKDLILSETINITGETDNDFSGHGTLVAGLSIFGADLPSTIKPSYQAKCKVLSLKVIHHPNDSINFPRLLEAIKEANTEHGVSLFNMSLVFDFPKAYNSSFSDFAYELDKLAYELNILIFISVGNFDSQALNELLTTDYHKDHSYPDFFYNLDSTSPIHRCENTNICAPSESLNNISIGALAANLKEEDESDITPINIYPAYYTRKFHFDYEQTVNNSRFQKNQKNKHLNKPDFVFDGGDLLKPEAGIEVLKMEGEYYEKNAGTSLAAPLIASMAAEIQNEYPDLHVQTIKALLINSASYSKAENLPQFEKKKFLLKKLTGFGKPQKEYLFSSDKNSITMVVEDHIKTNEFISIPIYLPSYLINSGNKLDFNISLAYQFLPDKGNHLNYLPLHISFSLVKNLSINDLATKVKKHTAIKNNFPWSEDHFGIEKLLLSNAQRMTYRLQPNDLKNLNGELAIAVRCIAKEGIDEELNKFYKDNQHPFSIVIRITEVLVNETAHELYDEMQAINNLSAISDLTAEGDMFLDAES